jgi:hypothetical protein
MPNRFFLPFFILLTCSLFGTNAQTSLDPKLEKYPKFISVTPNYGTVWKHHKYLDTILPNANPIGLEINIGWQTTGRKPWQQVHNYPRWGIQFMFYNLGNPNIYGNALFITPHLDLFLLKRPKHEIYVKIGTGIAFFTKYYNSETNPNNILVSLPVSASGFFSLSYRYILTEKWSMLLAFNFNHASNGSMHQPNLGINIPALGVGAHYTLNPERMKFIKTELPEYKKSLNFNANLSFSSKQSPSEPLNDVSYMAYTLTTYFSKRFTRKSILVAGMDGCLDESLNYELRNEPDYINKKHSIYRFAVTIGYEFVLTEKTHIMMQNAFYLYDPYKVDIPVYQRYGFKYMPIEHVYLGYYLKTHAGKADFWEFAVGVKI